MASTLTGLFGPTEDEVRQLIDEKGRADTQMLYARGNPLGIMAGNLANAGRTLGGALESLGGYEDPAVRKARLNTWSSQSRLRATWNDIHTGR